jgi:23S rRNA (adenine2503-C2)-methyltransferase
LALEGRQPRNIVFMGMGEPFHNEHNLHEALDALLSADAFHFAPSRITVSTVGVPEGMLRLASRRPAVRLALSLHSAKQETRERLIPVARKHSLDQLRSTIRELNRAQPAPVMIEYLMLSGVNDSEEDIGQLIAWLRGLRVRVNLIPFNPIDGAPDLMASDPGVRQAASRRLRAAGYKTTIRYSMGGDIAAACGQLARQAM